VARKKRFGVSLPSSLTNDLNRLAEELGVDRSRIVEEAVRQYVHDYLYLLIPHECMGVIIVTRKPGASFDDFFKVVGEYRDIIKIYSHLHVGKACVETMIVSGDSGKIRSLHHRLHEVGCEARYIPLKYNLPNTSP